MKSVLWIDPINRDAHFLKLVAEIACYQTDRFKVVTTQRPEMALNSNVPFQPFFSQLETIGTGSISILNKLRLISSYYAGFQNIVPQISPDTSILYSSGMSLPELESLGIQAIRAKASKVTMLVHNLGDRHSQFSQLSHWRNRRLLKQFDGWIFLSEYMRQQALVQLDLPLAKTYVMLHPHFHPMLKDITPDQSLASALHTFARGRAIMAYISKVDADHGVDLFYKVLRRGQDQGLPICGVVLGRLGKNWDLQKDKALIQDSGLTSKQLYVKLGTYTYTELLAVLLTADFVLAPYRYISQSGAIALALGEQVPVVASRVGANGEMVKDGINGLLFAPDEIDSLIQELSVTYRTFQSLRKRFLVKPAFNHHLDPWSAVQNMLNWLTSGECST